MYRNLVICGASALAICSAGYAQETDEAGEADEIIHGGLRTERVPDAEILIGSPFRLESIEVAGLRAGSQYDVTSSVTVLSDTDLAIRLSPNPVDQLRAVPGVGVSRSGSTGGLTQVRMRGAEANHTLILYDGIEMSDPVTGETDFGLLTGLVTQRIEALRGEASSLYGSDAIGGVIAIETQHNDGFLAAAEIGTQDTGRASVSYAGGDGSAHFGVAVSGFTTGGVDTSGSGGEADGSESYSGLLRGGVEFGANWELTGLTTYRISSAETDPDLNFDGQPEDGDRVTDSTQWLAGVTLSGVTEAVDHILRASYNTVTRENIDRLELLDETTGTRVKLSYSPSLELTNGRLSALIDFEQEDYERRGTIGFVGNPNQNQTFQTFGLAGEYTGRDRRFRYCGLCAL